MRTVVLLVALCCSASAWAFSYRAVTLKAGEGTGGDIVIGSDKTANVALDRQSSSPGQFYEENGTVYFRAPYLPASFTAPSGKIFTGWSDSVNTFSPGNHIPTSGSFTLTAQWADDADAHLSDIIPSQGTLDPAFDPEEYFYDIDVYYDGTPVSVTVTAVPRDSTATVKYDSEDTCPSLNEYYSFVRISVTNGANQNTYKVDLCIWYSISVITEGQGTTKTYLVYGNGEETNVAQKNKLIRLTATPAPGWQFVRWELVSGDGELYNETDQDGRYRMGTDNAVVRAVFEDVSIKLSDTEDNSTTLSSHDGETTAVALQNRTLGTDDNWNSLCLPFDVADFTGTPLEGFTVVELDNTTSQTGFNGGTLYLNFKEVTSIEAGKPYLVKKRAITKDTSAPTFAATAGTEGFANGFGYAGLVDGTTTNRWRPNFDSNNPPYCEFHTAKPIEVTGYSMISGNMLTTYDPKVWTLKARLKESDPWIVIDSRDALTYASDALPDGRTATKNYDIAFNQQGTYQYFRFEVAQNGGASQLIITNLAIQGAFAPEGVNVSNPMFADITLNATTPAAVTSQDGKVSFVGSYSPVSLSAGQSDVLVLGDGNVLYRPTSAQSIGSCRAIFRLLDGLQTTDLSSPVLGDIDGDGEVTVTDVRAVVNLMMNRGFVPVRVNAVDGNGNLMHK